MYLIDFINENKKACLTQLVEYRFCKSNVIGSSPIAGL